MADETKTKTAYHVLRFTGEGGDQLPPTYTLVARNIEANNAAEAVRAHVQKISGTDPPSGLYVAVPSRSWRPTKVTVETQTVLKLGEAT